MKTLRFTLILLAAVAELFAARAKPSRDKTPAPVETAAAPALSFDSFRLIGDRNIFSLYRSGRSERSSDSQGPRMDTLSLVGTMSSEKGTFAFFDGSDSSYRKALRLGESVGPFKVARIAPDVVDVERDGQTISMRVSEQMRRPDGGEWRLVGSDLVRAEAQAPSASGADKAPPAIPSDASETLRRLMEQRQKQLKQ